MIKFPPSKKVKFIEEFFLKKKLKNLITQSNRPNLKTNQLELTS